MVCFLAMTMFCCPLLSVVVVVVNAQVLLVKPVTFMNNSGESVAALAKFYRVPCHRVLVISDDLDQPVAQVDVGTTGRTWHHALTVHRS